MKNNNGIGRKLYLLIGFVLIFLLGIGGFSFIQFNDLNKKYETRLKLTSQYIDIVDESRQCQVNFKIQVQEWKNILLRGYNADDFNKYYTKFSKENDNVQEKLIKLKESMRELDIETSSLDQLINMHKELYYKYNDAIKSYNNGDAENIRLVDELVRGIDRETTDKMDELVNEIQKISKLEEEKIIEDSKADVENFNKKLVLILIIGIILIIISTTIIICTYRDITIFIEQFKSLMKSAEDGDFTINGKIHKNDELGQVTERFNRLIDKIRNLISDSKKTSFAVSISSNEIMKSSDDINKTSKEIADNLSNVAENSLKQVDLVSDSYSSVKHMVEGINRISENTTCINNLADKANNFVSEGVESLKNQSNNMSNTKDTFEIVTNVISNLADKSNEIGAVVEFINRITEQIDLLSLNASIEAARAGEAGRGFTVVANEVKNLAELSKKSTDKINNLILEVQNDIKKAVIEIKNTNNSVEKQISSFKSLDNLFNLIEKSVIEVNDKIEEVNAETISINENAVSVEYSIRNIEQMIEENAKATEEVASSADEYRASIEEVSNSIDALVKLSINLQNTVEKFKV